MLEQECGTLFQCGTMWNTFPMWNKVEHDTHWNTIPDSPILTLVFQISNFSYYLIPAQMKLVIRKNDFQKWL